ncbi:hypothetical protein DTO282F9_7037 [Paecilomyces variotii]|nr:hypothetical protein DTO282F9_7037 [Paecilomyces variotii]
MATGYIQSVFSWTSSDQRTKTYKPHPSNEKPFVNEPSIIRCASSNIIDEETYMRLRTPSALLLGIASLHGASRIFNCLPSLKYRIRSLLVALIALQALDLQQITIVETLVYYARLIFKGLLQEDPGTEELPNTYSAHGFPFESPYGHLWLELKKDIVKRKLWEDAVQHKINILTNLIINSWAKPE